MHQSYPSVPLSIKEVRLLLRRINKSIRILEYDLSGPQNQIQVDTVALNHLSDLIYSKALARVSNGATTASPCFIDDDPSAILHELI